MVTHLEQMKKELQRSEDGLEELERKEEQGEAVSERSAHFLYQCRFQPIRSDALKCVPPV